MRCTVQSLGQSAQKTAKRVSRAQVRVQCSTSTDRNVSWLHKLAASSFTAAAILSIASDVRASEYVLPSQALEQEFARIIKQRDGHGLPQLSLPQQATIKQVLVAEATGAVSSKEVDELLTKIDKLNAELQSEKAANARLEQDLKQSRTFKMVEAPSLAISSPVETKTEAKKTASIKEEGTNPVVGLLNGLGFVVAGGVGGYFVFNQSKSKEELGNKDAEVGSLRAKCKDLKDKADAVAAALKKEQDLVAKLRTEMKSAADNSERLLSLAKKEKEAAERIAKLNAEQLEAEKKLVVATKQAAAANEEMAQAERAAKFAAIAEAESMQQQLQATEETLERERDLAAKIGADAQAAMDQVKVMQTNMGVAVISLEEVTNSNDTNAARAAQAEVMVTELQRELAETGDKMHEQQGLLQEVGKTALSMKEAMASLKAQAGEYAKRAELDAIQAAADKNAAEDELRRVGSLLASEKDQVRLARDEINRLKAAVMESQAKSQQLEVELNETRAANAQLRSEVKTLQAKVAESEKQLAEERKANVNLKSSVTSLEADLKGVRSQLEGTSSALEAEKAGRVALESQISEMKKLYLEAGEKLESEQGNVMNLKKEAADLTRQLEEVRNLNTSLTQKLAVGDAAAQKALDEANKQLDSLKAVNTNGEVKMKKLTEELQKTKAEVSKLEAATTTALSQVESAKSSYDQEMTVAKTKTSALEKEVAAKQLQLAAVEKELTEKLAVVTERMNQAEIRAKAAESDLNSKMTVLQEQMKAASSEAEAAAEKQRASAAQLEEERKIRQSTEAELERMRTTYATLVQANEEAKKLSEENIVMLRKEFNEQRERVLSGKKTGEPGANGATPVTKKAVKARSAARKSKLSSRPALIADVEAHADREMPAVVEGEVAQQVDAAPKKRTRRTKAQIEADKAALALAASVMEKVETDAPASVTKVVKARSARTRRATTVTSDSAMSVESDFSATSASVKEPKKVRKPRTQRKRVEETAPASSDEQQQA